MMLQKEGFYLTLLATKMVTLSAVYQGLTMRWGWARCAISPQQTVRGHSIMSPISQARTQKLRKMKDLA